MRSNGSNQSLLFSPSTFHIEASAHSVAGARSAALSLARSMGWPSGTTVVVHFLAGGEGRGPLVRAHFTLVLGRCPEHGYFDSARHMVCPEHPRPSLDEIMDLVSEEWI